MRPGTFGSFIGIFILLSLATVVCEAAFLPDDGPGEGSTDSRDRPGSAGDGVGTVGSAVTYGLALNANSTTAEKGFPTAWFGYPLPAGQLTFIGLTGGVSVANSANIYSETLFIIGYLPSGACPSGRWPSSTPRFGPPGIQPLSNLIVKAPTQGTHWGAVDFQLPRNLPLSNCILVGLNGGTVAASHDVTSTSNLTLRYQDGAPPTATALSLDGEFCFGQSWGCQRATADSSLSFARVLPIDSQKRLLAIVGNISDSTFDGSKAFGAPPAGGWTALNDFYVYRGSDCATLGASNGSIAGPGHFFDTVPSGATRLLSVPISGNHIGAQAVPVASAFDLVLNPGDCLVQLYGVQGNGAFDSETQVRAILGPVTSNPPPPPPHHK